MSSTTPTTTFKTTTANLPLRDLPANSYLVHATNCLATWGSGIAAEMATIFPSACKVYKQFCNATKPQQRPAGDNNRWWPPRSLAGQCLVIPPQEGDIARGAPRVYIVCLFTSYGYGSANGQTGKPGRDTGDVILTQTRMSLKSLREQLEEKVAEAKAAVGGEQGGQEVEEEEEPALYSPLFNSGAFRVPWHKTLAVIREEFEGAAAHWTVLLPPPA